jgi:hypothetical protein
MIKNPTPQILACNSNKLINGPTIKTYLIQFKHNIQCVSTSLTPESTSVC